MAKATDDKPRPLQVAVLTVSDTRTEEDDTSGHYLVEALQAAGHGLAAKTIVVDDVYGIRAVLSNWIADGNVDAVLVIVDGAIPCRGGIRQQHGNLLHAWLDRRL